MKRPSQQLVNAFFEWFEKSSHLQNEDHYAGQVTANAIGTLTREVFIEFFFQFARDGGKIQSGGHRTAPQFRKSIELNYEEFRNFVLEPFGEAFDELKWLDRTKDFPFFGQGLATIYLNRIDKTRFAILNNKAVEAMSLLGVQIPSVLGPRYTAIRDAESRLITWFPQFENYYRADALTQFLIGEPDGRQWAEELRGDNANASRSWIYAPGEKARLWEQYKTEGVLGIGWDPLDHDLSQLMSEHALRKDYDQAYGADATDQDFRQLCDFLLKMKVGDRIFVKRGIGELVGYGEVDSGYFYDDTRPEYRHLRKATWLKTGSWPIPQGGKGLPVKTLTEIKEPSRLLALQSLLGQTQGEPRFGKKAFELLAALHKQPLKTFYDEHAEDFDTAVKSPLKSLMDDVASALPSTISDALETQKGLLSKVIKNDYGKGGAWDFYWAAFYPKKEKRTASPQLYVFISAAVLRFGFYIGDYGTVPKDRFSKNCTEHLPALKRLLGPALAGSDLAFGEPTLGTKPGLVSERVGKLLWSDWLAEPEKYGFEVMIEMAPDAVILMPKDELTATVLKTFERLYPLILLAQHDVPLAPIQRYLGTDVEETPDANPDYPLAQVAHDANMELDELEKWVRAIKRKRQGIFYGPPGTGKTFLARLLARHLVGGAYGFVDILQFHPSYAYEDFMQGLRPKALKAGGLEYEMTPGRFKDFCDEAATRNGPCVLIIDEINRANLSRVFGELMYLLEYRNESMPLAGGEYFSIPDNVVIVGTMNTADRSIALVDHALRRRFAFLALYPNYDLLRRFHAGKDFNPDGLIDVLERLNAAINDPHFSVGVTYFLDAGIGTNLFDIWQTEIEPYVEELFFDQPEKAKTFSWDKVRLELVGP